MFPNVPLVSPFLTFLIHPAKYAVMVKKESVVVNEMFAPLKRQAVESPWMILQLTFNDQIPLEKLNCPTDLPERTQTHKLQHAGSICVLIVYRKRK